MNQQPQPPETAAKSRRYRAGVKHELCEIKASLEDFRREFGVVAAALERRAISASESKYAD